jgi:hypothetical protein
MSMEHLWNDTDGKTEVLREKPVPVTLCPTQIQHGLAWEQCGIYGEENGIGTCFSPGTYSVPLLL